MSVDCYSLARQIVEYDQKYELQDMETLVGEEESILSIEMDLSSSSATDALFSRFNSVYRNPEFSRAQRSEANAILEQLISVIVIQLTA